MSEELLYDLTGETDSPTALATNGHGAEPIYSEAALMLPADLSYEHWAGIGSTLQQMNRSLLWWIGDWLLYGEDRWPERYSQAIDETPFSYDTLRHAAWVARKFPVCSRLHALSWSHYQEAAALPELLAEEVLREAESRSLSKEKTRALVKERKQELDRVEYAQRPVPATDECPALIEVADATSLPLFDGYVDLIVTSPPYGLDVAYVSSPDAPDAWVPFMEAWLREAYRVSRDGGRLALNVPLDTTTGGFRPTYAQTIAAAELAGWIYRFSIVWAEDNISKSVARGSMDSAAAPHVIAPVEMVAVFHKGDWKRETERRTSLEHQAWLEWTNGLWTFPGESQAWEGHPAPFPKELPRRLIHLLSFEGDTVLDPFAGSGTTVVTAYELGREALGYDLSPQYVASARRRLVAAQKGRTHANR
jgi:site-specific DNA-methyltransferase (adenine-specific)